MGGPGRAYAHPLGSQAYRLGSQAQPIRTRFSPQKAFFRTEILLGFISCPCGWSHTIPQEKKLDVEVLGCRGYIWSAVVRPVGRTAKFSEITFEVAYGGEINIQLSGNSSVGYSCSQHANCMLPQVLRHLWHCVV